MLPDPGSPVLGSQTMMCVSSQLCRLLLLLAPRDPAAALILLLRLLVLVAIEFGSKSVHFRSHVIPVSKCERPTVEAGAKKRRSDEE